MGAEEKQEQSEIEVLRQEVLRIEEDLINCKNNVTHALEEGTDRMDTLTCQIGKIETTVNKLDAKISLMIDIFNAGEGFFRVIGWIGKIIKWVVGIGVAVYAIKLFITTGHWK